MSHSLKASRYVLLRCFAVLLVTFLVSGCASTLSAHVTTFQNWPADTQGTSYRIVPGPAQVNNLEFQAFADMIRASVGPIGLVQAKPGQAARFEISIKYGNPPAQAWVRQNYDPFFYNGFGPVWGGYSGMNRGWGGGIIMMPAAVAVPVDVYKNSLTVIIKDTQQNGAEVYRSTATSISGADNLLAAMPYLARAVFDGFPGNNGQTRDITYERQSR